LIRSKIRKPRVTKRVQIVAPAPVLDELHEIQAERKAEKRARKPRETETVADYVRKLEQDARAHEAEDLLLAQIRMANLPEPDREFTFAKKALKRLWRFDFSWSKDGMKLAVEVNGGVYSRGRHSRGAGQEEDFIKVNEAQMLGWWVLQFSTGQVKSGIALKMIERAMSIQLENFSKGFQE
jgi:hypothetical protein